MEIFKYGSAQYIPVSFAKVGLPYATPLLQQVLERDLGPQHPHTLKAMYSLARVYASQNRYAEAEKLLEHVLAGEDKVYGLSHTDTQITVENLLFVYEKLGQVEEACRMLKQRISSSPS
jgi:tetratricopeptide (TPR) repeat protein